MTVASTVPPFGLKRTTATRVLLLRPPALPALDSPGSSPTALNSAALSLAAEMKHVRRRLSLASLRLA